MANSKFDYSLLKPISEKNSEFEKNLKPIEENEEDLGSYLDNLPSEPYFLSKLPRNILIGLTHAGRNLHNLPHDIVQGLEEGTKNISSPFNQLNKYFPERNEAKKISDYIPYDKSDYADVFGQQGEGTFADSLIQKGIEHAPELIGAYRLGRAGLGRLPLTQKSAGRKLKTVENQLKSFGVSVPINEEIINESSQFLPKTFASREMMEAASRGEYPASFSLQSQIGSHERNLRNSPLASERLLAPQARELKQRALGNIENELRSQGYHEQADLIKKGIDDYRKYIKIRDEVYPILRKIGIPTSLLGFLALGYEKGKKIFK